MTGTDSSRPAEAEPEPAVPVVDAIRAAIGVGEFVPNQRLVEADLSERFGASRASVRTALVQLTSEGLVERVQNRGARVRAVSLAEAIEITEVRMALEGLCAAKAALRLTEDDRGRLREIGHAMQAAVATGDLLGYSDLNEQLHALIRTLSGQATAGAILERLRGQNVRHQFQLAMHPGRASVSLPQHLEIIEALCAGDPEAAEAAMRRHIRSVVDTLPDIEAARPRRFNALKPWPHGDTGYAAGGEKTISS
jgi:DNA-binding GntR family transcriptional regulator